MRTLLRSRSLPLGLLLFLAACGPGTRRDAAVEDSEPEDVMDFDVSVTPFETGPRPETGADAMSEGGDATMEGDAVVVESGPDGGGRITDVMVPNAMLPRMGPCRALGEAVYLGAESRMLTRDGYLVAEDNGFSFSGATLRDGAENVWYSRVSSMGMLVAEGPVTSRTGSVRVGGGAISARGGEFYSVAFTTDEGGDLEVYTTVAIANGSASGGSEVRVTDDTDQSLDPQVVKVTGGDRVVLWRSAASMTGPARLLLARVNEDTRRVAGMREVAAADVRSFRLIADANRTRLAVVYAVNRSGSNTILLQRLAMDGAAMGAAEEIATGELALGVDAAWNGDNMAVVWGAPAAMPTARVRVVPYAGMPGAPVDLGMIPSPARRIGIATDGMGWVLAYRTTSGGNDFLAMARLGPMGTITDSSYLFAAGGGGQVAVGRSMLGYSVGWVDEFGGNSVLRASVVTCP